ncbi:MAG TPA: DUF1501 domain-containing protein [Pirellulales bacterium]|jgi:hypothetical protein|nr:DUF1501 domain-containing protein [Pirellulales bacterium]
MLTVLGCNRRTSDGVSRRDFLRVGALTVGGLSLADLLRNQAAGGAKQRGKAVIMVFLHGGPPHLDMYDMKPQAPVEFRGEFNPIRTNVPGIEICELMPRQAQIMDRLAILRGLHFVEEHSAHSLWTGFPERVNRPAFGSVVSYLQNRQDGLPPYVSLMNQPLSEDPAYCGPAHRPFVPTGPGLENLGLSSGMTLDRLDGRKHLLTGLDRIRRDADYRGALAGVDAYTLRALDMVASSKTRAAFDIEQESPAMREKYGRANQDFLRARRLVEAGISVVSLVVGGWDTHSNNFNAMRRLLPNLDQGIHALVSDLYDRGLNEDVAVVVWGEFGRTPRVNTTAGRDHWPRAGFTLLAGSQFKTGQVIGETDAHGESPRGLSMTSSHVLSSLYAHLGIDPALTIPDNNGRPMYLLDERDTVPGLV